MKMVKSLLLGTAAGLVAMSGAQAADLPVKAKPVQYVKICSLYGAGFYYIPGTDMCLKIGGWARLYVAEGANGNVTNGALATGIVNTRASENFAYRTRGYITADARNQTEYGTVRSYIALGYSAGNVNAGGSSGNLNAAGSANAFFDPAAGAPGFNANRAFIQFAGFTFGVSQSFFDIYSQPATSFWGGMVNPASDTGDSGKLVMSYTAQFGNGFSATIGGEAQRNTPVIGPSSAWTFNGGAPSSVQEGTQWPDIVGNLRIDQAWGSAQVMAAIHDASGTYTGSNTNFSNGPNSIGWAVGAGAKILTPMIGTGDYFQFQVNYAEGGSGYINAGYANMYSAYQGGTGGSYGFGVTSDNVYGSDGSANLTTSWGVNAAYEHFWSKSWQTSVYGAYIATSYNANANLLLCGHESSGSSGIFSAASGVCDNNWAYWNIGTRTQFNVDSQTYLGVDVVYTDLKTANPGVVALINASGTQPAAVRTLTDQSAWMAEFRVHRNFYP
jgi:hypothetical protein